MCIARRDRALEEVIAHGQRFGPFHPPAFAKVAIAESALFGWLMKFRYTGLALPVTRGEVPEASGASVPVLPFGET